MVNTNDDYYINGWRVVAGYNSKISDLTSSICYGHANTVRIRVLRWKRWPDACKWCNGFFCDEKCFESLTYRFITERYKQGLILPNHFTKECFKR